MTARDEIDASAALWGWEALPSPLVGEMIYRRGDALMVFVQFDKTAKVRRAIRYERDNLLLKATADIGWGVPFIASKVMGWFAADGERPVQRMPAGVR